MRLSALRLSFIFATLASSLTIPLLPAFHAQRPILSPGIAMPGLPGDTVILSDVLGRDRSINVFAGFLRDIDDLAKRIDDGAQNTTILAPLNSAITGMERKPWEDAKEYGTLGADAYEGDEGVGRAQKNLRRFVEGHVLPSSPWKEGEKVKTLRGEEVWWEEKDGVKMIQPGSIAVSNVGSTVANGEVWLLKGVIESK